MSHHSNKDLELNAIRKFLADANDLGPTGKFPNGKLTPHDEGEIKVAITHHAGKVVIEFGTSVQWFGMTPEQAVDIGKALCHHADLADQQR